MRQGKGIDAEFERSHDENVDGGVQRRGGFGIPIMSKLMDEVDFRVRRGKDNVVTMIKYLPDE